MSFLSALSAAGALVVCALRLPIARTMDLIDRPDDKRKRHVGHVPLVGGLAVFPAIALACVEAVSQGASDDTIAVLFGVVFGFFLIGYADDRMEIRPSRRLLLTLALFAGLILMAPGLMPPSFDFGDVSLPVGAGTVALLGIVGASGALNAINMADGQDGLCSGLLLIWLCFLFATLEPPYANAAMIAASALIVAIAFNLGTMVFLGDLGAYGVGAFVIALMLAGIGDGSVDHGQIVTLLTVPIVDCVWLMIERQRRGHSPYDPDRQHLHHILDLSLGRTGSLIVYLGVVTAGAAAATMGGWACVAAILAQAGFVAVIRMKWPRIEEVDDTVEDPKISPAAVQTPTELSAGGGSN
jgi:UDP-GlcNAc:undecaprenyl-phosphate GlcNAc-1-phosphate transferase